MHQSLSPPSFFPFAVSQALSEPRFRLYPLFGISFSHRHILTNFSAFLWGIYPWYFESTTYEITLTPSFVYDKILRFCWGFRLRVFSNIRRKIIQRKLHLIWNNVVSLLLPDQDQERKKEKRHLSHYALSHLGGISELEANKLHLFASGVE